MQGLLDYYLVTPTTIPAILIAALGMLVCGLARVLEIPIMERILSAGLDGLRGDDTVIPHDTRFSRWCLSNYTDHRHWYDLTIDILRVSGCWTLELGWFIGTYCVSLVVAAMPGLLAGYMTFYLARNEPTIEERARVQLMSLRNDREEPAAGSTW